MCQVALPRALQSVGLQACESMSRGIPHIQQFGRDTTKKMPTNHFDLLSRRQPIKLMPLQNGLKSQASPYFALYTCSYTISISADLQSGSVWLGSMCKPVLAWSCNDLCCWSTALHTGDYSQMLHWQAAMITP